MRTLVYAHGKWHICVPETNKVNGRSMWVYAESTAFCCYVDEQPPVHSLPPKPRSAAK